LIDKKLIEMPTTVYESATTDDVPAYRAQQAPLSIATSAPAGSGTVSLDVWGRDGWTDFERTL